MKKVLLMALVIAGAFFIPGNSGHSCRWKLCPYKGVKWIGRANAVTQYVGEDYAGSDSWCIDMLHLEHPKAEYEELEDMLFKH